MDEYSARKPGFVEGTRLELADGQTWSLPGRLPGGDDPEFDGLLRAILESEDHAERLRGELALTILLLSRNYDLGPEDFQALLGYPPGDPALSQMQSEVHRLVLEHAETFGFRGNPHFPSRRAAPESGRGPGAGAPGFRRRFLSSWSLWLN